MKWQDFQRFAGGGMTAPRAKVLCKGYNAMAIASFANTVPRCAMILAQTKEESAGFHATEEYASGAEYEGRADLGNIYPGDGVRFKGRTLIQTTGRNNYGNVSHLAFVKKLVPTKDYFVQHPTELSDDKYAWLGPEEYWRGNHNHGYDSLNAAADNHDIYAGTLMVNGWTNGLATRILYWNQALAMGDRILPTKQGAPMFKVARFFRAVLLGGNFATPALKEKYPNWIDDEGVLNKLKNLRAGQARLQEEIKALRGLIAQKQDKIGPIGAAPIHHDKDRDGKK